jgi:hypothetical protein
MRSDHPVSILRELYRGGAPLDGALRDRLGAELAQRYAILHPAGRRKRGRALRPAFAAVGLAAVLLTTLAAVPAEYRLPLGFALRADLPSSEADVPELTELTALADSLSSGAPVSVSVSQSSERTTLLLLFLGEAPRPDLVERRLREAYPALERGELTTTDIVGRFEGSLLGKVGHEILSIDLSRKTAAQARSAALLELARHGRPDASLEIRETRGRREIEIRFRESAR